MKTQLDWSDDGVFCIIKTRLPFVLKLTLTTFASSARYREGVVLQISLVPPGPTVPNVDGQQCRTEKKKVELIVVKETHASWMNINTCFAYLEIPR